MSGYRIGIFSLIGAALLTALSQVFYAHNVQAVHPFVFTAVSFFITACYFQLFSMRQRVPVQWNKAWKPLVKLNAASALTFMSFYFALKYIEPAIVSALEMGVGPLFVLLLLVMQKQTVSRERWIIAAMTLLACCLLMYAVVTNQSGDVGHSPLLVGIAIVASVVCGIGAVLCSEYSKALSDIGWTSSMILAKRYIAIIVLSLIFTYDVVLPYIWDNVYWIVAVTIGGVLLPNYFLQKGIQYTSTFIVMMSLSFVPVLTFAFQLFDPRLLFSMWTLAGVSILLVAGLWSIKVT